MNGVLIIFEALKVFVIVSTPYVVHVCFQLGIANIREALQMISNALTVWEKMEQFLNPPQLKEKNAEFEAEAVKKLNEVNIMIKQVSVKLLMEKMKLEKIEKKLNEGKENVGNVELCKGNVEKHSWKYLLSFPVTRTKIE